MNVASNAMVKIPNGQALDCFLFPSGITGFTTDGEQVGTLQVPWFKLYLKFLEDQGLDVTTIRYYLPNQEVAVVFRDSTGELRWTYAPHERSENATGSV